MEEDPAAAASSSPRIPPDSPVRQNAAPLHDKCPHCAQLQSRPPPPPPISTPSLLAPAPPALPPCSETGSSPYGMPTRKRGEDHGWWVTRTASFGRNRHRWHRRHHRSPRRCLHRDYSSDSWSGRLEPAPPPGPPETRGAAPPCPRSTRRPRESKTSGNAPEALKVSLEPIAIEEKSKTRESVIDLSGDRSSRPADGRGPGGVDRVFATRVSGNPGPRQRERVRIERPRLRQTEQPLSEPPTTTTIGPSAPPRIASRFSNQCVPSTGLCGAYYSCVLLDRISCGIVAFQAADTRSVQEKQQAWGANHNLPMAEPALPRRWGLVVLAALGATHSLHLTPPKGFVGGPYVVKRSEDPKTCVAFLVFPIDQRCFGLSNGDRASGMVAVRARCGAVCPVPSGVCGWDQLPDQSRFFEYQSNTRKRRSVFQRLGLHPAPSSMSKWT